jgi:hypothetical protein
MKNLRKLIGFISIIAIIACAMAACDIIPNQPIPENKNPVAEDYEIGNLTQYVGSVTAVTIMPKSGKSSGARTIYYEGTSGKSTTLPTAAGTYDVTFNVAAASGWNAATDLSAGTLTISIPTPVAGDYEISGLWQKVGSTIVAVTITPKTGKSPGAVSNIKYAGNATLPSAKGTYAVTFDVAAASGWSAAAGLSAGNLEINEKDIPVADDFTITKLKQAVGSVTAVEIKHKEGKSTGTITTYYAGKSGTNYAKSTTLPTAAGTYAVTFDVAAAGNWNPATGLSAGDLVLTTQLLSVEILGEPKVGNTLKADVVKSFSGKVEYQWWREDKAISDDDKWYEDWPNYDPQPIDVGKKISVKVKCGDVEATSPPKTIQSFTYTVSVTSYQNTFYARVLIDGNDDRSWPPDYYGFSIQWYNKDGGKVTSGGTSESYTPTLDYTDREKKIKAEVKFNNQTVTGEFQIPSVFKTFWSVSKSNNDEWESVYNLNFTYPGNFMYFMNGIDKETNDSYPSPTSQGKSYTVNGSTVVLTVSGDYYTNWADIVFPGTISSSSGITKLTLTDVSIFYDSVYTGGKLEFIKQDE